VPTPGKPRSAPTIDDLSEATGLSRSTVSRVLTGSPNVKPATREQILEAMDRLGFRVNQAARSLRTARSALVGLLVPSISNELFAETAERLDAGLREHGIGLAIASSGWDLEGDLLALDFLASRGVDAVVAATSDDRDPVLLARLAGLGCPVILLDRAFSKAAYDAVLIDHRSGIHEGLAHLADLGHRRVGFCTLGSRTKSGRDLLSAFTSGVKRFGMAADRDLIGEAQQLEADPGRHAADAVLAAHPTALIAAGPLVFMGGILERIYSLRVKIPKELSVIGYTDAKLAPLTNPPLTSIERPVDEAGRVLASMILERLADPAAPQLVKTLKPSLVIRSSTGPAPA
jgi:DNA-binding LacI/PurR family transcriptional regulator